MGISPAWLLAFRNAGSQAKPKQNIRVLCVYFVSFV